MFRRVGTPPPVQTAETSAAQGSAEEQQYLIAWQAWADQVKQRDPQEYQGRLEAMTRMVSCLHSSSSEVDLVGLDLTSLPELLPPLVTHYRLLANPLRELPLGLISKVNTDDNYIVRLNQNPEPGLWWYQKTRQTSDLHAIKKEIAALEDEEMRVLSMEWVTWCSAVLESDEFDNRITAINALLTCLREHKTKLDLEYLNLSTLPGRFPEHITKLSLEGNELTRIDAVLPTGLEILELGCNRLTEIPANLPDGLIQLKLDDNPLLHLNSLFLRSYAV
ncbi:MAG: hypothetical protein ACRC5A_03730 [Enterobacteriaceae bacterium]